MKRATSLLVLGATSYVVVAWQVSPGFYDCCAAPQAPYNWVSPPPFVTGNLPPKTGHGDIAVRNGIREAASVVTDDAQIVIGFLPGVLDATGKASISVDIHPVANFPEPKGLRFVTNVYLVTASAALVNKGNVVMLFSNILPAPSDMYLAPDIGGSWQSIGANSQAQPYTINTTTDRLGYFAAGYPSSGGSGGGFQSQALLPIAIAILIAGVLLAGIPLAIVRHRRETEADDAEVDGS